VRGADASAGSVRPGGANVGCSPIDLEIRLFTSLCARKAPRDELLQLVEVHILSVGLTMKASTRRGASPAR